LSIKPEFVQEIINGNKKFEYRKRIFKKEVESVIIYSTKPEGKIIGEFTIEKVINETPNNIWHETHHSSGISKEFFFEYFSGYDEGFAIKIKEFIKYKNPIDPKSLNNKFNPPQSFMYIKDDNKLFNELC
jgi:predicted transcriptional regulator